MSLFSFVFSVFSRVSGFGVFGVYSIFTPFWCRTAALISDNPIHFKLPYRLIQRFGGHMDIPIHCGFNAGVSQQLLQHLWAASRFQSHGLRRCDATRAYKSAQFPLRRRACRGGYHRSYFCRFPCTPVDKDQITHYPLCHAAASTIHVLQSLLQHRRRFSFFPAVPHFAEDLAGRIRQRNGAIAVWRFGRSCPPRLFAPCRNSSVLFTVSVRFSKSTASHVSPINSPVRKPVSRINAYWL